MSDVIKICKKHGALIEIQVLRRKNRNSTECKNCISEKRKEWLRNNQDRVKYLYRKQYCKKIKKPFHFRPELPEGIVKICKIHGELNKDQVYARNCAACTREWRQKRDKENPELFKRKRKESLAKHRKKFGNLLIKKEICRRYNISIQEYDKIVLEQKNKCYICGKEENRIDPRTNKTRKLFLDHCHKTGKVRKLLCMNCNFIIGFAKDSIETLQNAANYLREFQDANSKWPAN